MNNKFGTGAIKDIPDERDFKWGEGQELGFASIPFDWSLGYDIEKEISAKLEVSFKLPVKNQGGSYSCGGQAWSYLGQVLDTMHDLTSTEKSAKYIYSQTFVGAGGSGGRENSDILIKQGVSREVLCPSYENGNTPSEAFMQRKSDITEQAKQDATTAKALSYANVANNIEEIAKAIRDNHGIVIGITGMNNGTWLTAHPKKPTVVDRNSWNHWLYAGKVKEENGVKYIGVLNSWGDTVGEKGWQWISQDYIEGIVSGARLIWSAWTMVIQDVVITPPPVKHTFYKTLKYKMVDTEVVYLQKLLKQLGFFPTQVPESTRFGDVTLAAVKKFQSAHNLLADGIIGPKTNTELNKAL